MPKVTVLPTALQQAIEVVLKNYPLKVLKEDFITISQRINNQFSSLPLDHKKPPKSPKKESNCEVNQNKEKDLDAKLNCSDKSTLYSYGQRESAVYLATQFPFNYGFLTSVLSEIRERNRTFFPSTILDFGAGPGTAYWCCLDTWNSEKIKQETKYVGIDISQDMIGLGESLLNQTGPFPNAAFKRFLPIYSSTTSFQNHQNDLVVCNFSLLEIYRDKSIFEMTLGNLWKLTKSYFIVVNRADKEGFHVTQLVKDFVVENGGYIFAPCSNDLPSDKTDCACVFTHKIQLTELQRQVMSLKIAQSPLKFTYIVACKGNRPSSENSALRIVGPPSKLKNYVEFNLCSSGEKGLVEGFVTKRESKEVYTKARKSKWGELWSLPFRIVRKKEAIINQI